MRRLIIVAFLFISFKSEVFNQQYFFDIDKDTVIIGEPVTLTLQISNAASINAKVLSLNLNNVENLVYEQDTSFLEPIADIEVIDPGTLSKYLDGNLIQIPINDIKDNTTPWIQNIRISIYSVGVFYIPGIYPDSEMDTIRDKIGNYIFVIPPEGFMQDSTRVINDIKPIIEVETSLLDYLIYIYWILGLILVSLLAFYIYKKIKGRKINVPTEIQEESTYMPPIIKEAPHLIALRKLNQMQSEKIWMEGKIKEYQSELTETIREYLEGRFMINALEMTTGEIIQSLKNEKFEENTTRTLIEILTVADLVKFAKAQPTDDIHQSFLDRAIQFVEQTKAAEDVE